MSGLDRSASLTAMLAWRPRRPDVGRRRALWLASGLALLASLWLDGAAYRLFHAGKDSVEWRASYQVVRSTGTLWFWAAAALIAGLARPGGWRRRVRAALWVFCAAGLAGFGAEVLKVVIGRERPLLHDGSFVWRPMASALSTAGLSFPSSHAAVAFGGAWMVWRLGRGAGVWGVVAGVCALVLAGVCGVSRLLTGAHFLGDVVGAAILGAVAAMVVHRLITPGAARRWPLPCLLRVRFRGPEPGAAA